MTPEDAPVSHSAHAELVDLPSIGRHRTQSLAAKDSPLGQGDSL